MRLLLASKSPRRRELINALDVPTSTIALDVDESISNDIPLELVAETIARKKSDAYDQSRLEDDEWLVTADTIVVVDGEKLGKPHSREEAVQMLQKLSDKFHTVYTGVCLKNKVNQSSFTEATRVHFRKLSITEIEHYVDTFHPTDKAGAYGIQEWIGMIGIDRIEGDFYNVMGLPLSHLYRALNENQ